MQTYGRWYFGWSERSAAQNSGCSGHTFLAESQLSEVGVGDEISWETVGFQVEPLEKLFDSLLSSAGLGSCAPAHTPGVKSETSSGRATAAWSSTARAVPYRRGKLDVSRK